MRIEPLQKPSLDGTAFGRLAARFGARVRVAALSAASEPSQEAETGADRGAKENVRGRLGYAARIISARTKPDKAAPHQGVQLCIYLRIVR